jgi:nucleotidyltransferase/DNA polymerase involved in DNA repair
LVEPPSLDEAYLDVTDSLKRIATAWETAKEIRARIRQETDLTASARGGPSSSQVPRRRPKDGGQDARPQH